MYDKIKKLGLIGIIFFTVKGLLWLTVPAIIVVYRGCAGEA